MARVRTTSITQSGERDSSGTLRWMAPEQLDANARVTAATDIYSLAVVMWEILTGQRPYEGAKERAIERSIEGGPDKKLPVPDALPEGARLMLRQCWENNLAARPTCAQLIHALKQLQAEETQQRAARSPAAASAPGPGPLPSSAVATGAASSGDAAPQSAGPDDGVVDYEEGPVRSERAATDAHVLRHRARNQRMWQSLTSRLKAHDPTLDAFDLGFLNEPYTGERTHTLSTSELQLWSSVLASNTHVRRLNLYRQPLNQVAATHLVDMIQRNRTLEDLCLQRCKLSNRSMDALAPAVASHPSLRLALLSGNEFGAAGLTSLCTELMKANATLQKLYIDDHRSFGEAMPALAAMLRVNTSLQLLDLSWCELDDAAVEFPLNALPHNSTLRTLKLTSTKIGDATAARFAALLRSNACALTELSVDYCSNIKAEGVAQLAEALQDNHRITSFDLKWEDAAAAAKSATEGVLARNMLERLCADEPSLTSVSTYPLPFPEAELYATIASNTHVTSLSLGSVVDSASLSRALSQNRSNLTSLNLMLTDATDTQLRLLAPGLTARAATLRELFLWPQYRDEDFNSDDEESEERLHNFKGRVSAVHVVAALQGCSTLEELGLSFFDVCAAIPQLAALLRANRRLRWLDFSSCALTAESLAALKDTLATLPSLTRLILTENRLGDEGARVVAGLLGRIPTLEHVDLHRQTGDGKIGFAGSLALARAMRRHERVMVELDRPFDAEVEAQAAAKHAAQARKSPKGNCNLM
jgi:Ran GTPase-activating protein (RanGAP) involved in mRNA processing and transport